jgi:hypothetical protein
MYRILTVGCIAALLFGVSGCGSSAESNVKEQISLLNDMADAAQKKDQAKITEIGNKLKDLQEQFKKFSEADQKAALEKHVGDLMQATMKAGTAQMGGAFEKMGGLFGGPDLGKAGGQIEMPKIQFPGGSGGLPDLPKPPSGGPELPKPPAGAPELPKLP